MTFMPVLEKVQDYPEVLEKVSEIINEVWKPRVIFTELRTLKKLYPSNQLTPYKGIFDFLLQAITEEQALEIQNRITKTVTLAVKEVMFHNEIPMADIGVVCNRKSSYFIPSYNVTYKGINFLSISLSKPEYDCICSIEEQKILASVERIQEKLQLLEELILRKGNSKDLEIRVRSLETRQGNLQRKLEVINFLKNEGQFIVSTITDMLDGYGYKSSEER